MANKCNLALAAISGFLFAGAWWIFIDGVALADKNGHNAGPFWVYVPGILTTIGCFIMCNLPPTMFVKGSGDEEHAPWQKALLVFATVCEFAGLIEGIWCYVEKKGDRADGYTQWRGVSAIVQSVLIAIVTFGWNFMSVPEE
jgi:hypothetical protein